MRKRRVTDKQSKKCRKIGVRSYQRDNFSEKRISRVYYTSELRFWGVFVCEL